MKKIITYILTIILALTPAFYGSNNANGAENISINSTNFPDAAFRKYIKEEFDLNGNGSLSRAELENVEHIDIPTNAYNIKGINRFPNLYTITGSGCEKIKYLYISGMKKLEEIDFFNARLSYASITNCPNLWYLNLENNCLTSADIYDNDDLCFAHLSNQEITIQLQKKNRKYMYNFNNLIGFDKSKATFDELYLDGATVSNGVIKWNSLNDIPNTIYYTYDCGIEETTVEVNVKKPQVKITSIKPSATKVTLNYGKSCVINTKVLPGNAANKTLSYSYLGKTIKTESGVKITPNKSGTKYLYIKTLDGSNITKKVKIVVRSRKESKTNTKWKSGKDVIYIYKYTGKKIKIDYIHDNGYRLASFTKTCKLKNGKATFKYKDEYGNWGKGTLWVKKNYIYLKCREIKPKINAEYSVGTFKKKRFKYAGTLD